MLTSCASSTTAKSKGAGAVREGQMRRQTVEQLRIRDQAAALQDGARLLKNRSQQ